MSIRRLALAAAILALLPGIVRGQNQTEILLLGTNGGPPLRLDRSQPSTLLVVDGRLYLIDCGIGTMRRLVRAKIRSDAIGTIFITHHHPDHDLGLAAIMANDYFAMDHRMHSIDIYGPPQTRAFVDASFRYISIPFGTFAAEGLAAGLSDPFIAHDIEKDGVVFQDDRIRVIAAENSHYMLMPAEARARMKSYSYRIETPHGVVVFTGDTGRSDAVVRLAEGADVLVSEVHDPSGTPANAAPMAADHSLPERQKALIAHFDSELLNPQQVGEMASKARVRSVLLYHFHPKDPAVIVAGVKKFFSGPVFAGADLARYCVTAEAGKPALALCPAGKQ